MMKCPKCGAQLNIDAMLVAGIAAVGHPRMFSFPAVTVAASQSANISVCVGMGSDI